MAAGQPREPCIPLARGERLSCPQDASEDTRARLLPTLAGMPLCDESTMPANRPVASAPALAHGLLYGGVDEARDIATQTSDLAHQRGGDEAVLLGRREEQCFSLGNQVAVHAGQLEFVLEIRNRTQAADDHTRTTFLDEMGK